MDRSNIEQIETLGNKFFHSDSEMWIKLENQTHQIKVKGEEDKECKYVHSNYGTLYEKHKSESGKVSEYIARWHEKEKKVRVVFSQLFDLVLNDGASSVNLEFPFSSLVIANHSGIYQHVCLQRHPSYFLYPDLAGAPEHGKERWVGTPKRNFIVVSNTHLTTQKDETYLKREVQNPTEEQFVIDARRRISSKAKFSQDELFNFVLGMDTDPLVKKRKDLLIHIYRKAKYLFFPDESMRKECDQLIAYLEKWDHHYQTPSTTPVFILWDYFFREYTFNHASSSEVGRSIAKHKVVTDNYWTAQMELWKVGTSYGECDSDVWDHEYRKKLYGTGENSTCFFNIMRGINRTREVLRNEEGGIPEPKMADYAAKKLKELDGGYLGSHVEEAFSQFFSKNLAFSAEVGSPRVVYWSGYQEQRHEVELGGESSGQ